ncbi:MAG: ATP-binding cassette domain-containing protein [Chloroflexi bacterium]|nr:ATP-binding cassette domain-containing protein [Chloroflexota bacterium]
MNQSQKDTILLVKNLKMYFPVFKGILRKRVAEVKAVDNVSFSINKGETLGLVGETGCGKTTIGRCILRVYRPTDGEILFNGVEIAKLPERKMGDLRRRMSLIFQDSYGSLNPRQNAGNIVGEPIKIHHLTHSRTEYHDRIRELFQIVGLDPSLSGRFPHEFSGGQRQRLGIARALASEPSLIVCDEPISALDVSIQAQIVNLLHDLGKNLDLTYLFIAHDLSVVRHVSDKVAVMYLGRIVEMTDWKGIYENPLHPYTKALLSAIPIPDPFVEEKRERIILEGDVPSALHPPTGCSFHNRCPIASRECSETVPQLINVGHNHEVACLKV